MTTIYLNGNDYASARAMHEALKMLLDLPGYYGHNADALHDCLSERVEPVRLAIASWGGAEVEAALRKCAMVVEDTGGEVLTPDGGEG